MATEQTPVELTTRDVFQQVDRRLTLIEGDLRGLYDKAEALDLRLTTKLDDKIDGLRNEMTAQNTGLRNEMDRRFSLIEGELHSLDAKFDAKFGTLDAKFDAFHLATQQDISAVKQDILVIKQDLRALELRLTVRLGGMMVVGITVVATLVKLL